PTNQPPYQMIRSSLSPPAEESHSANSGPHDPCGSSHFTSSYSPRDNMNRPTPLSMVDRCRSVILRRLGQYGSAIGLLALLAQPAQAQNYAILGTGTSNSGSTTSYPNPYNNYYYGARHQLLITAAQLQAAGVQPNSQIVSLGFNVTVAATGAPATNLSNWQVRLYKTTAANPIASNWYTTDLVAESTPTTLDVSTTGWKQTAFSAPYVWNGTDNLVVETCFNNSNWNSGFAQVQVTTSGLGSGTWSRWYRDA